ncbi:MAG: SurA N-terminal domain-containing protein [Acidobacteriota bacterium]|jgi:peptidyl-prolyl cis-trans isomerase SurA|nr:SurA N-terminal domain-containing protein [Acidobacteriota bacterium]
MRERVILVLIGSLMMALVAHGAERVVVEGVLVRVNERIVTISDFTERIRQELTQMPTQPNNEELQQFTEMLLDEMVSELVLLERAQEKRLNVEDEMVDNAIENLRKENNLEDDQAWEEALSSSGMTVDALRERYQRSMLLQRAVQGEVRPVEITEEELRLQYELDKEKFRVPAKVNLEQVFLVDDGSNSAEVSRRARGMVDRVRSGADLKAEAILAGAELQELGAIPADDCRPELMQALEPLNDGDLTDPLVIPGGVQIVRLVQRIPAGFQPFEEVVDGIRRQHSAETYESQTRGLVEKLKNQYLVEVHQEYLDVVFANLGGA